MARRRYFRYYPRTRVAKKKWASNLKRGELTASALVDNNWVALVENKVQADAPTPTIIKTGNFKVQGDVYFSTDSGVRNVPCIVYVFYVPEGVTPTSTLISAHPEWIMGWTYVDTNLTSSTGPVATSKFSMTSRLKRNLNSGDKVVLIAHCVVEELTEVIVHLNYLAQYWTCAN